MIEKGIHPSAVIDCRGSLVLPETTIIEPMSVLYSGTGGSITFGERNIIYPQCSIRIDKGWMETGDDVSFGPGCHIYEPRGGLKIGDNCLVAGGAFICGVEHGFNQTDTPIRNQPVTEAPIIIENDVWLGMAVTILPGVTIGEGSVIGAGSIVNKDIPPYSVAYGTPCEVKRSRKQ